MNNVETTAVTYNQPREWLLWTMATIGGWLSGSAITFLISLLLSMTALGEALNATNTADISQETMLLVLGVSLLLLAIIGVNVGVFQWLVLRRHLFGLQRWAIYTGLGLALGVLILPPLMGLGVGLAQWLLLRRDLNKTVWWPVMNAVVWPLGYIVGDNVGLAVGQALNSGPIAILIRGLLAGVVIGVVTGAVLLWLLRENATLLEGLRQEREAELAKQ